MKRYFAYTFSFLLIAASANAQGGADTTRELTLENCIAYALSHQPSIRQYQLDERIAEEEIQFRMGDWFPQIGLNYNVQHNLQLPTSFLPDANGNKRAVTLGVKNTSAVQFSLNQNIFNRDVLLASRSAASYRLQARQLSSSNKIDVAVEVSKAYYDLLLTRKQVEVLDENIVRLQRSLKDAFDKYEGGIVDKIDYKRAQIALNSTRAQRKAAQDAIAAKQARLQELMGLPGDSTVNIRYDSLRMESEVAYDTIARADYSQRIEYKLLQTRERLLEYNLRYNRWSFLPSVSASASYNPTFQNDKFTNLYNTAYPTSFVGLQLAIPIFQGGKRLRQIRIAQLDLERLQEDKRALSNSFNSEFAAAMSGYKGSLANLNALKENLELTRDVYTTLRVQYDAGIKTYLDVIIAETDYRSAQINYLNALYQVLSNKLDLQRASGAIVY